MLRHSKTALVLELLVQIPHVFCRRNVGFTIRFDHVARGSLIPICTDICELSYYAAYSIRATFYVFMISFRED